MNNLVKPTKIKSKKNPKKETVGSEDTIINDMLDGFTNSQTSFKTLTNDEIHKITKYDSPLSKCFTLEREYESKPPKPFYKTNSLKTVVNDLEQESEKNKFNLELKETNLKNVASLGSLYSGSNSPSHTNKNEKTDYQLNLTEISDSDDEFLFDVLAPISKYQVITKPDTKLNFIVSPINNSPLTNSIKKNRNQNQQPQEQEKENINTNTNIIITNNNNTNTNTNTINPSSNQTMNLNKMNNFNYLNINYDNLLNNTNNSNASTGVLADITSTTTTSSHHHHHHHHTNSPTTPTNEATKTNDKKANRKRYTLADFDVTKKIGQGKYSKVYLANLKGKEAKVALKVLPKTKEIAKLINQIRQEIKIQSHLHHKNILKFYDYFRDEKNIYIILEYAPKGSLSEYQKIYNNFSEDITSKIIKQIAEGLMHIHKKHIVHRDLKPGNILIGEHNEVKISDFGCAVSLSNIVAGTLYGTLDYFSPEMIENKMYDEKVDIWSLGVIMYELLVGKTPFDDPSVNKIYQKIKNADYTIPTNLSKEASDLLRKILRIDPKTRYTLEEILNHPWITQYNE